VDKILYPLTGVIAWIAFLYKLRDLRHDPKSPMLRSFCAALASVAYGLTFATPVVYVTFDRLVGVPNLARLMMHVGIMSFSASVQRLLLHWAYPGDDARARAARRIWVYVAAVAALTTLFILAPVDVDTVDFTTRYGDDRYIGWYMTVYIGYFGVALADIMRLCWRYAKAAGRPFLRVGLRCSAVGAGFGAAYTAEKAIFIVGKQLGVSLISTSAQENLSPVLSTSGATLVLFGLTLPAWGPSLASLAGWIRRYLAYQRLRPLWQTVYRATAEIALDEPVDAGVLAGRLLRPFVRDPLAVTDLVGARDLDYRLVRRVVEIRDGLLALRPYLDGTVAARAELDGGRAGLEADRLQAAIEAAVIAEAVVAKATDRAPAEEYVLTVRGGENLTAETAWLVRVAGALRELRQRPAVTTAAKIITELAAPAVMAATQLLIVALAGPTGGAATLGWWALATLFGSVLPIGFILWGARTGRWASHHVPQRGHRLVPLGTGGLIMALGVGVLAAVGAPADLARWLATMAVLVAVLTTVTIWWKISAHAAFATASAALLTAVAGPIAVVTWPLVGVTGWSRLRLRAHTTTQLLAGGALGAVVAAIGAALLSR
jgi:membrane-associated phospholipid phosphatase